MKKQILFVQGGGAGTHDDWDNKLVGSLTRKLGPDYEVRYPLMPDEDDPDYAKWKAALLKEIAALGDGALLVGHSIGGTVLINVLADTPPDRKLAGVFLLAAPFVGAGGWPSDDIEPMVRIGAQLSPEMPIYLYHGDKDETAPFAHLDLYEDAIPAAIARRLPGRDHQLGNDLTEVAADIRALA